MIENWRAAAGDDSRRRSRGRWGNRARGRTGLLASLALFAVVLVGCGVPPPPSGSTFVNVPCTNGVGKVYGTGGLADAMATAVNGTYINLVGGCVYTLTSAAPGTAGTDVGPTGLAPVQNGIGIVIEGNGATLTATQPPDTSAQFRLLATQPGGLLGIDRLLMTNGRSPIPSTAGRSGGAVSNAGFLWVVNSTFSGNSAVNGGAIDNLQGVGPAISPQTQTSSGPDLAALKNEIQQAAANGELTPQALMNRFLSQAQPQAQPQVGSAEVAPSDVLDTATILLDSTVTGNQASGVGGAVSNPAGLVFLAASTISGNNAPTAGGIGNGVPIFSVASIVANNSNGNCLTGGAMSAFNVEFNPTGTCGFAGEGDLSADPLLAPLADNGGPTPTMALKPGSPAINAIPPGGDLPLCGALLSFDQRGVPRPQGPACDIGAFEVGPVQVCTTVKTDWRAPYKDGTCPTGYDDHLVLETTSGPNLPVCIEVKTDWRAPYADGTCPTEMVLHHAASTPTGGLPVCIKVKLDWRDPYKDGTCPDGYALNRVVDVPPLPPVVPPI